MSLPVNSHRVEVTEEEREREQAHQEKRDGRQHTSQPQPFPHHYYSPGPYWNAPYMYMAPPLSHFQPASSITIPEGSTQHYQYSPVALPHQPGQHPQYLAVNVHTDNHQHQSQKQAASNSNRQITVKEKIIKNVTRGLEQLLDTRVLAAGLATFLLPRVAQHLQQQKRRRKGLFLEFGLA